MHRSGTSATTGVLHLLNVNLGTCLQEAQEGVNPKGFWEHLSIVEQHENLLDNLNSGWWDALPLPRDWQKRPEILPYRERLTQIIQREFSGSPLWAIKDPRLCRLMPLWLDILAEIDVTPHYLLVLRHPAEVAASLAHRDGISPHMSALIWLRNVLESERETRQKSRSVIAFEALLSDWHLAIGKVAREFKIYLPQEDADIVSRIETFLDPQLRHHSALAIENVHDPFMAMAIEAYDAILMGDNERINAIGVMFEQETTQYTPWLKQIGNLMTRLKASNERVLRAATAAQAQRDEVIRIKSTVSWRITAPLRAVSNFFRN